MDKTHTITEECLFMHATDGAVLFDVESDEIWIPRECIVCGFDPDDYARGDVVHSVEITWSIALSKGLVE